MNKMGIPPLKLSGPFLDTVVGKVWTRAFFAHCRGNIMVRQRSAESVPTFQQIRPPDSCLFGCLWSDPSQSDSSWELGDWLRRAHRPYFLSTCLSAVSVSFCDLLLLVMVGVRYLTALDGPWMSVHLDCESESFWFETGAFLLSSIRAQVVPGTAQVTPLIRLLGSWVLVVP